MGKTILALLVALVVGFSLIGCKEKAPATQPLAEEAVEMPAEPEVPLMMEEEALMEGEAPAEGMEEAPPAEEMPMEGAEMAPMEEMEEAEPAPEAAGSGTTH